MKNRTINRMKKSMTWILLMLTALCLCSCNNIPTRSDAEKMVAQKVPEPAHFVAEEDGGIYVFVSDLRDLEFEVRTVTMQTGFGGSLLNERYSYAIRDLYTPQLSGFLEDCSYCNISQFENEGGFITFYIDDPSEVKEVARLIAECNTIVADQFNYTPDADLTDSTVMGIKVYILPSSERNRKISYPRWDDHRYYLNGLDGEDELYDIITGMDSKFKRNG